jgi:repressor of nif and glnA expression
MPPVVPWMTRTDRYILDLLDQGGIIITPSVIWLNLRRQYGEDAPSKRQISRRLRNELSEHGLVNQPFADEARGYYELTELGERFLHDSDAEPAEFIAGIDDTANTDNESPR